MEPASQPTEPPQVDLLRPQAPPPGDPEPRPRKPLLFFGKAAVVVGVFAVVVAGALSYRVATNGEARTSFSFFGTIRQLVTAGDRELRGEDRDRVNILLMGIGGEGHEGAQLTDTIMLASWRPSTGEVGLLSIPRDMAVDIPGFGQRKINAANAYGETAERGSGPLLAARTVEQVFGQPVDYYLRVDFDGFAQLIDDVGGIDVYVDRSFQDSRYPTHGMEYASCGSAERIDPETGEAVLVPVYDCRFETLRFTEGWTQMDGDTALKYVRSRYGTNGEASDFARSRRQQKVIAAVKEKVFSAGTLLNPVRLNQMRDTLQRNIATNFETWELLRLANELKDFDVSTLRTTVLDSSNASPLYATSLNGAYVLLPKNDDWRPVREAAERVFEDGAATPTAPKRLGRVEVQNATAVTGLAHRFSLALKTDGFEVTGIGNAEERGLARTLVYDLTGGKDAEAFNTLLARVDGTPAPPGGTQAPTSQPDIDFLVVLGQNSANLE